MTLMADRSSSRALLAHAERRPFLVQRGEIVRALRAHFVELDFVEVETSALQVSPGNETHVHALRTELISPGDKRDRRYLRTSPEFACKKLLAIGERRIVEFARVFRNRERSPLHHPEFTLIEWYRAHGRYELLMDDCMAVIQRAAHAVATRRLSYRDRTADPFAEAERLTVAEAFQRYAGIDLLVTLTPTAADHRRFAVLAHEAGIDSAIDDTWGDIFSRVLVEKIEPHLGLGRTTILYEYPAVMSALARPKKADPRVAERFELYACGVELANGFGEQSDPLEQRRRLSAEMDEKERIYGERYPIDEDFIAALAAIRSASGVALGLDRLVMLASGAPHIEQVLWSPVAE
jgi:elongation factor P--(R)-beta-lysine ligase